MESLKHEPRCSNAGEWGRREAQGLVIGEEEAGMASRAVQLRQLSSCSRERCVGRSRQRRSEGGLRGVERAVKEEGLLECGRRLLQCG